MSHRTQDEDRSKTAVGEIATPAARVRASLIAGRPGRAIRALLTLIRDSPPNVGA